MKNLFRLRCILSLLALTVCAHAHRVLVAGVKQPADRQFATLPLIEDSRGIGFPRDWQLPSPANPIVWEKLQRKRANCGGTACPPPDIT